MTHALAPFELPTRRITRCEKMQFGSLTFFLHCGFHPDGSVREIFVSSKRETMAAIAMLTEQCIAHSHKLQHGPRLADLEVRSDLMLQIVSLALEIERDEAKSVRAQYAELGMTPEQWRQQIASDDAKCAAALAGRPD